MKEINRWVPGYEGFYSVTNKGDVFNRKSIKLKPRKNNRGYLSVVFSIHNKKKSFLIHRLVLITFTPNTSNKTEANHKDKNKTNNNVENLEWVTPTENMRHRYGITETHCSKGHEFNKENTILYNGNHRNCRICYNKNQNRRNAKIRKNRFAR